MKKVLPQLHDGITTKKIYSLAFKELKKIDNPSASRYEIKWAIMRLGKGKQGFSFERFAGKLFTKIGFDIKLNQVVKGKTITHEIDLEAKKNNEVYMVECKHRSKPGIWIHIQVPLYVYARFLDLEKKYTNAAVVTNSRFSHQCKKYAKGVGLSLIGWDYPKGKSLRELIDKFKLYPITVLRSVDDKTLGILLEKDIVVVSELLDYPEDELAAVIGRGKMLKVIEEAKTVAKKK